MLKMIIRKEIELVQKVSNVDTTKRIHLREGQNTWKSSRNQRRLQTTKTRRTNESSSLGLSGVNQLTLTTLSYSSKLLIGIGI
jgi:hypothetical protein